MTVNPNLIVLSRPVWTGEETKFLDDHGFKWSPSGNATDAEKIIEFSGRLCYLSFHPNRHTRGSTAAYIDKLIKNGHESVLEHAQWTFILDGVTRGFSHQLVRHRVGFSFSQLSQQYHDESKANFIKPIGLEHYGELENEWNAIERHIHTFYERVIEANLQIGDFSDREKQRYIRTFARALLPNATRTILSVTANARSLRHFLLLRGALEGDIEMRQVSQLIFDMLRVEAPAVVFDFEQQELSDGSPIIVRTERTGASKL